MDEAVSMSASQPSSLRTKEMSLALEDPPAAVTQSVEKGNKIIKDGHIHIEVDELENAKQAVDTSVSRHEAYFENESFSAHGNVSNYHLKIRVPSDHFEPLFNFLADDLGMVRNKNITARDVTEEFIDLNSRLESNRAYLARYRALLNEAKTIKDVLEIEEKIRRIQEEIDSRQGRLNFLKDQVNYSTINLTITQIDPETYEKPRRNFMNRISAAFSRGITWFVDFIIGLVGLWPFLLMGTGVWYFRGQITSVFKRNRSKK